MSPADGCNPFPVTVKILIRKVMRHLVQLKLGDLVLPSHAFWVGRQTTECHL